MSTARAGAVMDREESVKIRGRMIRSFIPALAIALFLIGIGTAAAAENAATLTVDIGDNNFTPASLTINAGDTVTWTNKGRNPHDVTSDNGSFTSPRRMMNGATFSFTFNTPGTYNYSCTIHSGQNGTIIVQGAPAAAPRTGGGGMAGIAIQPWQQLLALGTLAISGLGLLATRLVRRVG